MVLALPSVFQQVAYFCDRPECLSACLLRAKRHQPITKAWKVPMTASCDGCGVNLYDKATGGRSVEGRL